MNSKYKTNYLNPKVAHPRRLYGVKIMKIRAIENLTLGAPLRRRELFFLHLAYLLHGWARSLENDLSMTAHSTFYATFHFQV
jgi:hypothetical protein